MARKVMTKLAGIGAIVMFVGFLYFQLAGIDIPDMMVFGYVMLLGAGFCGASAIIAWIEDQES